MRKLEVCGGAVIVAALFCGGRASASSTANLLLNPGAETGTGNDAGSTVSDWTVGGSSHPGRDNGSFDGFTPHGGSFDFYGGSGSSFPDGSTNAAGTLSQEVDLVSSGVSASTIDAGDDSINVEFFEQSLNQGAGTSDAASVTIAFENASHGAIAGGYNSGEISSITGVWQDVTGNFALPAGTRFIEYQMNFFLNAGTDVDSFVDDNSLTVSTATVTPPPPPPTIPLPAAAWSGMATLGLLLAGKTCRDRLVIAKAR